MTKLNITNKTIYKLKKNKNQSKKNVPKKRKYKKRKHKNGRSFRKRRRKYNIKNNSIKKYKKQRGGAGEIDKTTAKSKDDKDKLKRMEEEQRDKEEEIKRQQDKLDKLKASHIDDKSAIHSIEQKILKLGLKQEDENTKLKKLDDYKVHVEGKLKEQKEPLKALKNNINTKRTSIEKANTTIRSKTGEIGKLNGEIKLAQQRQKDLQKRIDNAPEGQIVDSLKEQINKEELDIGELQTKIQAATEVVGKQTKIFTVGMHEFNKTLSVYFNNQKDFNSRPQTEEVKITDNEEYKPNAQHVLPDGHDDNLQTKIDKFKLPEPPEPPEEKYEANKKLYLDHKDIKLDKIVKLLTDEQKWISARQKEIENRRKEVEKKLKTKNNELEEQNKTDAKEEKEQQDKISKEKEEKDKIKENIENKKEEMRQDVKEWQRTQDEASEKIEDGETVFHDKIKKIADEDNRTIENVKQDITNTEKELKSLKTPGFRASKADKDKYKNDKKNITDKLAGLKKEYNEITKGEIGKLKKPGVLHSWGAPREYKKKVEGIEKEALEDKKKSIESRGARKKWAKAGLLASKVLHSEFKSTMIKPHISDDVIKKYKKTDVQGEEIEMSEEDEQKEMDKTESFQLLYDVPYISNDNDDVYARATKPGKPNYGKPFYNYYLKKIIKTDDKEAEKKELTVYKMIEQRKARFLKSLMYKDKQLAQTHIENITTELKKFEAPSDIMRNSINEKIIALSFLRYIMEATDDLYIPPLAEDASPEDKEKYEKELKKSRFERSMIDLHKTTIDGHSLFKLFSIYIPDYLKKYEINADHLARVTETTKVKQTSMTDDEIIELGLNRFNGYAHLPCPQHDATDNDVRYLEIAISKIRGEEFKWPDIDSFEEEGTKVAKEQKENTEAEQKLNEIKEKKDKALKDFTSTIEEIKNKFNIQEIGAKITEKEKEVNVLKKNIETKKLEMDKGKLTTIKAQENLLKKQKEEADKALEDKNAEITRQQHDIESKGKDIENLEENLKAQRTKLAECQQQDEIDKEELKRTITQLEAEKKRMEEEQAELNEKITTLGQEKEDALKTQEELSTKITTIKEEEENLENDINDRENPTIVPKGKVIDAAGEEDALDEAFDDATKEEGIDLDLENDDEVMVYIRRNSITGDLEIATSKLPGENISNWLMGAQEQDGAGK